MVEINLLPWRDYVQKQQRKNKGLFYLSFYALLVCMLWVISIGLSSAMNTHQARLAVLSAQLNQQPPSLADGDVVIAIAIKKQRILEDVLSCLSYSNVSIFEFSDQQERISFKGSANSAQQVQGVLSSLARIKNMDFVKLVTLTKQESSVLFEVLMMERKS